MGYHSKGCSLIYGDALTLAAFWAHWKPKLAAIRYAQVIIDSVKIADDGDGKATLSMEYANWKWHTGYAEVEMWSCILQSVNDYPGLYAESLRVGENDGDIEIHTYGNPPSRRIRVVVNYAIKSVLK